MINPNLLRLKQRAYIRIDTLPENEKNDELAKFCVEECGVSPVYLPIFPHGLDETVTRAVIARYLLEAK